MKGITSFGVSLGQCLQLFADQTTLTRSYFKNSKGGKKNRNAIMLLQQILAHYSDKYSNTIYTNIIIKGGKVVTKS